MSSPRTNNTEQTVFTRPLPDAVTYDLSTPDKATITLPVGSHWTSGPHWHATHTEYLQVLSGAAQITLEGQVLAAVTSASGPITVPRGAVHEWRRSATERLDEEVVVREWTDPADGQKEVFFRGVNGIVLDALREGGGSWKMRTLELDLMNLFWRMDNWPVVLGGWAPAWMQGAATRFVLGASVLVGQVLGDKGVYAEYGGKTTALSS
jgi:hypothetical protein